MPKSKNTASPKYPTDKLLRSRALAGYQLDFAAAILTESEYTIEEAQRVLNEALRKGVD